MGSAVQYRIELEQIVSTLIEFCVRNLKRTGCLFLLFCAML